MLLLLIAQRASALDWLVAPSLRLRESYSDNALLAPPGQEKSDFITEIAPAIALIATGPRLQLHLDASWRKFLSRQRADSDTVQLQGAANAELLKDWLHLDARASVSQQNISPFGAPVIDTLPDGQNRSTVRATVLSPYLRHRFPALGTAELRYTRANVSGGNNLLSTHSDELQARFDGEPRGRGWTWNASADVRRTQDSVLAPQRKERASVGLRYPFSRKWAGTASVGAEKEGYEANDGRNPQGRFWSLGGVWTPSPRTSVAFSTGRRFFGQTYSLDAHFLQRHNNWSLQYSEDITTMPAQFARLGDSDAAGLLDQLWRGLFPDAQDRRLRIDAFLRYANAQGDAGALNYFSHRYYLQKQLKLNLARATPKSTLLLGATAVDRTAQTDSGIDSALLPGIDLGSTDHTRQLGASAGWSWRASARGSVNVNAAYASVRSLSTLRRDDNLTMTAGYSRILQPNMTAAIDVRRTRHHSNRGGNFRENGVSATLTMRF